MKKFLLFMLTIAVLAIAGAIFFVASGLDGTIKQAIESTGTDMLGEPVSVGSVDLSLTSGAGEISELRITNPDGYTDPNAFYLGRIRLDMDVGSLAGSPKRLNAFVLESPEVYLEVLEDDRVNLEELASHLQKQIDQVSSEEPEVTETEKEPAEVRLAIDTLTIAGAKLTVRHRKLETGMKELTLPDITLKDVGGSDGMTGPQLSLFIVEQITESGMKQALQQEVEKQAEKLIEKGLNSLFN